MVTVTPETTHGTTHVGFVGLGIMGLSMAGHIQAAGYPLHVFTRSRDKAAPLVDAGAEWHDDPAALAAACDVVITMVGYPADVEAVYFGQDGHPETGILAALKPGAVAVDMTTSSPSLAERIAAAAAERGAAALDAPVSGGDVGARNATLAIMVGGDEAAFQTVKPLFEVMGQSIALLGPAGAGQHTKMVNQTVIAGTILGVAEGLAYGRRAGLDLEKVLEVIGGGAAGGFQLNVLGKRMVEGDFAPGFFVHHFIKDMGIAGAEAERMGLDLQVLTLARTIYERFAADEGGREDGTQGIFRMIAKDPA
ncbi:NAD(P)-dependent oxidoreductase [uncultured Rhodospira sp.]|uniref:NAD(P)-dependent oxidoreductase n=1 Tax=uncultured Rhodospira sp. TaxID=1936189 RepID=UPI00261B6BDC|nr:NAD(P)-dependent oxidoreductase [uncultured Rhodospira sp.]